MKVTLSQLRAELARVFPGDEPSLAEHGPDGIRWHHMIAEPRGVQMIVHAKSRMATRRLMLALLEGLEQRGAFPTVETNDLWVLVLGYVRYAMGRKSTAPSTASNFVRVYWQHFTQQQRTQILREVMDELMRAERSGKMLGMKCYHDTWTELAVWMGENGGRTK